MLDSRSLEVISKFKLALLTQAQNPTPAASLAKSNRGKKLIITKSLALQSKVVEYEGSNHLVLTNDVIERSNYRNKRRWLEYYRTENDSDSYVSSEGDNESESDEDDENPLKKLRLSEILAPLAHPSEIITHPAISKTYRLTCLSSLASDLIDLIEVEQNTLNHLNKLLLVLDGEDWFYLLEENMGLPFYDHGLDETATEKNKETENLQKEKETTANGALKMNGTSNGEPENNIKQEEGHIKVTDPFFSLPQTLAKYEAYQQKQLEEAEADGDELEVIQQDLVNYLQVSIQRQQEYIKNLSTIRNGIVKVDRYKGDLYKWGKEMNEKKN